MRRLSFILAALLVPAAARAAPCPPGAAAPAVTNANAAALLSAFGTYGGSAGGQALLAANQQAELSIYTGSSLAAKADAAANNVDAAAAACSGAIPAQDLGVVGGAPVYDNVLGGAAGGAVAQALTVAIGAGGLPAATQALAIAQAVALGDSTYAKGVFGAINVYGQAYGDIVPNSEGDPRPYETTAGILDDPWYAQGIKDVGGSDIAKTQWQAWFGKATYPSPVSSDSTDTGNLNVASFPSGHSTYGNTVGLLDAVMVPQLYRQFLLAGVQFAYSRNVLGVHYPLDVIGGRLIAEYDVAQLLNDNPAYDAGFAAVAAQGAQQLQAAIGSACGGTVAACVADGRIAATPVATEPADYRWYLTYGLPSVGPTDLAPVVPAGAEVLIASRFPYLSDQQRRDVLASTELPSGVPLDNGSGWARLDLFAAAGGYGAFTSDVTVTMDAAAGGFSALDTWSNDIAGPGGLTKAGSGTLILSGGDSYAGGTTVAGGVLGLTGRLGGDLTIAPGATFASAGGYAVAPGAVLENAGLFESAAPLVSDGVLSNDGVVQADVASAGTLMGSGVIEGDLAADGVVAPGHSIGTVAVTGDVTLGQGATYQAQLGPGGTADLIVAGGRVTLGGATLSLSPYGGFAPVLGQPYTVLRAAGGIGGGFGAVVAPAFGRLAGPYPFIGPIVAVGGGAVTVTLSHAAALAFTAAAATPNQLAVAAAADALPAGTLQDALAVLDTAGARGAFDRASGDLYAAALSAMEEQGFAAQDAVLDRLAGGVPGAALAPGSALTMWLRGLGDWQRFAGGGNAGDVAAGTGGVLVGVDAPLGPDWRGGVSGEYAGSQLNEPSRAASGTLGGGGLGAYAGGSWGPVALRLGVDYAWVDGSVGRAAPGGAVGSQFAGGLVQGFGEAAAALPVASPFVRLAYLRATAGRFAEAGAVGALDGAAAAQADGVATLGLRTGRDFLAGGVRLTLHATLGWQRVIGATVPRRGLSFAGTDDGFTVSGAGLARDAAVTALGLDCALRPRLTLGLAFSGRNGGGVADDGVTGSLSYRF